jgi:hypothetical protein
MTEPVQDRRQTVVPPPNNLPYVIAVVVMMLTGVASVTAVTILRPDNDNTAVIATLVGFLAPTTLSLLAFMKSQETHLSVNSRLDAFMANAKLAAHAQGRAEGRTEGQQWADARTDTLARTSQAPPPSGTIPTVEAPVVVVPPKDPK